MDINLPDVKAEVEAASRDGRALYSLCHSCQTLMPTDCKDWIPEAAVAEALAGGPR